MEAINFKANSIIDTLCGYLKTKTSIMFVFNDPSNIDEVLNVLINTYDDTPHVTFSQKGDNMLIASWFKPENRIDRRVVKII